MTGLRRILFAAAEAAILVVNRGVVWLTDRGHDLSEWLMRRADRLAARARRTCPSPVRPGEGDPRWPNPPNG